MINVKTNEIYQLLKEYIVKKSKYNPSVLRNVIDNQYPLVVFENNVKCYCYEQKLPKITFYLQSICGWEKWRKNKKRHC